MAKMIPARPRHSKSPGEGIVWGKLAALPDDVTVFHSFHWNGEEGSSDREGEIDFIVVDPNFGVMVIEVKGGQIAYRDGNWFQGRKGTDPAILIDPYVQASDNLHFLQRLLSRGLPEGGSILFGKIVWFPDVNIPAAKLPPNTPASITLDGKAVEEPEAALEKARDYWRGKWRTKGAPGLHFASEIVSFLAPQIDLSPTTETEDVAPVEVQHDPEPTSRPLVEVTARPLYLRAANALARGITSIAHELMLLPVRFFLGLTALIWELTWALWTWCWEKCKMILLFSVGIGLMVFAGATVLYFAFSKFGAAPWILGGIGYSLAAYATYHLCERLEVQLARMLAQLKHRLGDSLRVQF